MSFWVGSSFQNGVSPTMMKTDWLLDYTSIFLWSIIILILGIGLIILVSGTTLSFYSEVPSLELFWTIFPGIILIFLGIPSLSLLYSIETEKFQDISVKMSGHQWYWSYDYMNSIMFDSYLDSSSLTSPRSLETDNHLVLPLGKILGITTSEDVLHSWALPSLGVKMDAAPGRLNTFLFESNTPGMFYGQCSEICGANHSFMPIVVEFVSFLLFKQWSLLMKE